LAEPRGDGPIRVLRVIARLNVGGPALHVVSLADGLQGRGYETTLVAGEIARGEESMAFVAEQRGVRVVPLAQLRREVSPLHDVVAALRLARLVRELRPHIVHTHTAKAGAVGRLAVVLSGVRPRPIVVHTFHGHVLRGYFGPLQTGAYRLLERLLGRVTDALVAVSPQVRDDLVALGVAPRERFAVVRLGIELDRRVLATGNGARTEARRLLGIGDGRFVVGWIGRMTAVKRTDDLLEALARLRGLGVDAVLCLVGDGPDRDAFEERAHALGVARHVFSLGYQEDVSGWYAAFDALVLPSANEGTPVVAIEALAAGTPVVANRVGGVPDVVRDGVDGYLVELGDLDGLADRLARVAADGALRRGLAETGRARVLRRYAVARLVDDVDRLYRALLAARRSRSTRPS
jgi:glycosyltransferase involved in cell wall biosynthesis